MERCLRKETIKRSTRRRCSTIYMCLKNNSWISVFWRDSNTALLSHHCRSSLLLSKVRKIKNDVATNPSILLSCRRTGPDQTTQNWIQCSASLFWWRQCDEDRIYRCLLSYTMCCQVSLGAYRRRRSQTPQHRTGPEWHPRIHWLPTPRRSVLLSGAWLDWSSGTNNSKNTMTQCHGRRAHSIVYLVGDQQFDIWCPDRKRSSRQWRNNRIPQLFTPTSQHPHPNTQLADSTLTSVLPISQGGMLLLVRPLHRTDHVPSTRSRWDWKSEQRQLFKQRIWKDEQLERGQRTHQRWDERSKGKSTTIGVIDRFDSCCWRL